MHVAMWLEQRRPLRTATHVRTAPQRPADRPAGEASASPTEIPTEQQRSFTTEDRTAWSCGLICLHYLRKHSFAQSEQYRLDVPAAQHRSLFSDDPVEIAQLKAAHAAVAEHGSRQNAFA
jgi:hypothetical protein